MGAILNPKTQAEKFEKEWNYEFEEWRRTTGFDPIELVFQKDTSESYEMNRVQVFKNKRGDYAIVHESGCSCYDPSQASIDFCDDELEATKRAINLL